MAFGLLVASLGSRSTKIAAVSSALVLLGLPLPTPAWAQSCAALALPNPIYGTGSAALTPALAKVATAFAAAEEPITILYADPGNCMAQAQFEADRVDTPFKYWTANGSQLQCAPSPDGQAVDFGYSSAFEACTDAVLPASIGRFLGPVNVLDIVTALDSSETSISAEALYFIYGWGEASEASPWTSEERLIRARPDSFAQQLLAAHIGVPSEKFKGTLPSGDSGMLDTIVQHGATDPNSTLGFTLSSSADKNRGLVKTLAYQQRGQTCGYWPDSTADAFDKSNVRTGLYGLWSPSYFWARVDAEGGIENPSAAALIGWFQGVDDAPSEVNVIQLLTKSSAVPTCAMQVSRDGLAGALASYLPESPCGCYFEATATGVDSCERCEVNGATRQSGEVCRFGFWESH